MSEVPLAPVPPPGRLLCSQKATRPVPGPAAGSERRSVPQAGAGEYLDGLVPSQLVGCGITHPWDARWALGASCSGLRGTAGNPAGTREALFVLRKLPDGKETGTDETLGVFFWQNKHQNGKKDKRAKENETSKRDPRRPDSRALRFASAFTF